MTDIVLTRPNFVVDMARHVAPHLQPILQYFMLAILLDKMRVYRIRGTSLDTLSSVIG